MPKTARLNQASATGATGHERATLPSALDSESQYLYILVPMSAGQQVLRTRLTDLLDIAEPIGDVFLEPGGGGQVERGRSRRGVRADAAFADITIGFGARTVTKRGGSVALTPLEFDLLVALYDRKGAAASRSELLRDVWRGKNGVTTRTVDTHIFNLRQKLESDPSQPAHFVTVSKIGYRLKL